MTPLRPGVCEDVANVNDFDGPSELVDVSTYRIMGLLDLFLIFNSFASVGLLHRYPLHLPYTVALTLQDLFRVLSRLPSRLVPFTYSGPFWGVYGLPRLSINRSVRSRVG